VKTRRSEGSVKKVIGCRDRQKEKKRDSSCVTGCGGEKKIALKRSGKAKMKKKKKKKKNGALGSTGAGGGVVRTVRPHINRTLRKGGRI